MVLARVDRLRVVPVRVAALRRVDRQRQVREPAGPLPADRDLEVFAE